ncbi:MAG: glycerophosphodiester phosphodiesterase [Deltaproteobacteria bacterium]|nr:glycerophosphodiester phosphodiesterase [Deltaproteobacteria bacterium]
MTCTQPLIIAHRGAAKYAPENTLPAFQKAIDLCVDGVELDLQLTKDKVPVVIHEETLTPFTTTYPTVQSAPLRALRTIDIGSHFGPAFAGERVPTLDEVLECLRPSALRINLELKAQPYWHFGLEERVVAAVRNFGMADRVICSSFSPLTLWRLRRLAPEIPRALLLLPRSFLFLHAKCSGKITGIANVHLHTKALSAAWMALAATRGWHVWVWTANTREEMQAAAAAHVEAIITDDPLLAREVLRSDHAL